MSIFRHPYDGKPYYCITCGLGLGEIRACEEAGCRIEGEITSAQRRKESPDKARIWDERDSL